MPNFELPHGLESRKQVPRQKKTYPNIEEDSVTITAHTSPPTTQKYTEDGLLLGSAGVELSSWGGAALSLFLQRGGVDAGRGWAKGHLCTTPL